MKRGDDDHFARAARQTPMGINPTHSYTQAMPQNITDIEALSAPVSLAIRKALRPLIRLLLHFDVTYPRLLNLLKVLYIEVAESELSGTKRPSDSSITFKTGVHRKDVARLRGDSESLITVTTLASTASIGAQLVSEWLANPRYSRQPPDDQRQNRDAAPQPLALPLKPSNDGSPSFPELVTLVCKQDMRPRAVLDEWLRLGVVLVHDGRVQLNVAAFAPQEGIDEKAFFFGRNIQDHIASGGSNLRGNSAPFFDRSVFYDELSESSIAELKEFSERLGSELLSVVNARAYKLQQTDALASPAPQHHRFNLGVFNYHTPTDAQGAEQGESDVRT